MRKSIGNALLSLILAVALAGCQLDATNRPAEEAASTVGGQGSPTGQWSHPFTEAAQPTVVPPASTASVFGPGRPVVPTPESQPIPSPLTTAVSAMPTPVTEPAVGPAEDQAQTVTRETDPEAGESDVAVLVAGNNAFALDLYGARSKSEGNVFYSPHSISLALALAYAGARGDTELQMAETLHLDLPQDRLHSAFNALDISLAGQVSGEENDGSLLKVVSSVWAQEGHGFLPGYLETLALNYGEEVRSVDFKNAPRDAGARINYWVSDETAGRITHLISPDAITDLTRLVLANAVYFRADWQQPFDARATSRQPFYALDGTESRVEMMRQQSHLRYAAGNGYRVVELPYKGRGTAMTILVPDSGRFSEFEESLSGSAVMDIMDRLDYEDVRLTMPRFKTESALRLSDTLRDMGMENAFEEGSADFSGMDGRSCQARGDICLLISDVLHKAFVSVDEAGTEAAAATAVTERTTQAFIPEETVVELNIDRPFIFFIRDLETGSLLFLGRMVSLR